MECLFQGQRASELPALLSCSPRTTDNKQVIQRTWLWTQYVLPKQTQAAHSEIPPTTNPNHRAPILMWSDSKLPRKSFLLQPLLLYQEW